MQEAHKSELEHALSAPLRSVSKKGFAELVGVSPGRISQLVSRGLPVEPNGKIDIARGKLWIAENVSTTRSNAQVRGPDLFGDDRRKISLNDERTRLAKEQADAAAMRNAAARRELIDAHEVEREWVSIMRRVRSGVLAVPSRIRQLLPHLTAHDVLAIDEELRKALEDLAHE